MPRTIALCATVFSLVACASGGAPSHQVHTSVRTEPLPTQVAQAQGTLEPAAPPALPQLATSGRAAALADAPERRLSEVDVPSGTTIASAVSQLGAKFGLAVSVDPEVRGTINQAHLRNVTLTEALEQIVVRNGAQYQLNGSVLRIVPVQLQSKTFPLDYVALSRVGTMSTVVQRRLTGASGGIGPGTATGLSTAAGAAGAAGGGDVLTAQSVTDIWLDIRVALTGILSAGLPQSANGTGTASPPSQAAGAAAGSGPQVSSTNFPDGSILIISPTAGLITVTATPRKIAAVEQYLADFQASILRQVMIQAKIVEVSLNTSYQFGIDWSVVAATASNRFGVTLRSDPSVTNTGDAGNISFKFSDGSTAVNAVLTALSSQGTVKVLSNETTTALNNQRAIFQVTTDEIFFSVTRTPLLGANGGVASTLTSILPQQVSVGVVLDVLPQISADNVLTMDIRPAVTKIERTASITTSDGSTATAPVVARREGDTIARMRAGETMMIGGLVQTRKETIESGIPVLKDIPLLGRAFRKTNDVESRSELVVFLTPTIISGQPAAGR